jgi:hypothetical protein
LGVLELGEAVLSKLKVPGAMCLRVAEILAIPDQVCVAQLDHEYAELSLDLGMFEPDLTRVAMPERHPMAWIVQVNGFMVDARTLPEELQDEARRRGLIPDLQSRRAA